jgi:hypothetical protein
MKTKVFTFALALIALFSFGNAYAQNPNLKSPLTSSVNKDNQLVVCYDISGLGKVSSVLIELKYDVEVNSECFNRGQKEGSVPGQSQSLTEQITVKSVPVRNGRAAGCITTTNTYAAGSCPSGFRSSAVTSVSYSNITFSILGETFNVPDPQ